MAGLDASEDGIVGNGVLGQILVTAVFKQHGNGFLVTIKVIVSVSDDKLLRFSVDAAALVGRVPFKGTTIDLALLRVSVGDTEAATIKSQVVRKCAVDHLGVDCVAAETTAVAVTGICCSQLTIVKGAVRNRNPAVSRRCSGIQRINIESAAVTFFCDTVFKPAVGNVDGLGVNLQAARRVGRAICKRTTGDICPRTVILIYAVEHRARLVDCGTASEITIFQRHSLGIGDNRASAQSVGFHRRRGRAADKVGILDLKNRAR